MVGWFPTIGRVTFDISSVFGTWFSYDVRSLFQDDLCFYSSTNGTWNQITSMEINCSFYHLHKSDLLTSVVSHLLETDIYVSIKTV